MARVRDVAAYILGKTGPMSAMKLQKLVYYGQAWSLVWDDRPLFDDRVEAWANGPVVPSLYRLHAGLFTVNPGTFSADPNALEQDERDTVDGVLEYYGHRESQWLSDLTHSEAPWQDAYGDRRPGERCTEEITPAAMAEYYGSL